MARKRTNQDSETGESNKAQMDLITNPDGTSELGEAYTLNDTVTVKPIRYSSLVMMEYPAIDIDDLPDPPKNGLTEGRMVHFVMANGEHRAAVIVRAWKNQGYSNGEVNLSVFTDHGNDANKDEEGFSGLMWQTSVPFDDDQRRPGTWHWIEPA